MPSTEASDAALEVLAARFRPNMVCGWGLEAGPGPGAGAALPSKSEWRRRRPAGRCGWGVEASDPRALAAGLSVDNVAELKDALRMRPAPKPAPRPERPAVENPDDVDAVGNAVELPGPLGSAGTGAVLRLRDTNGGDGRVARLPKPVKAGAEPFLCPLAFRE